MAIEQAKVAELHLIFGPFAYVEKVPGVTQFQYTDEANVERRGANNFGNTGPVAIIDSYQGVNGSFTVEGVEGEDIVQAIVSGMALADFIVDNPKKRYPFYIVANAYDEDGATPLRGHFIDYAKLNGTPAQVGPEARQYQFQALSAKRARARRIRIEVWSGAATPVTTLPFGNTPQQDDDGNYALVLLRQTQNTKTVKRLRKATDYTETSTAITLTSGLTASEKALAVYIASPT